MHEIGLQQLVVGRQADAGGLAVRREIECELHGNRDQKQRQDMLRMSARRPRFVGLPKQAVERGRIIDELFGEELRPLIEAFLGGCIDIRRIGGNDIGHVRPCRRRNVGNLLRRALRRDRRQQISFFKPRIVA